MRQLASHEIVATLDIRPKSQASNFSIVVRRSPIASDQVLRDQIEDRVMGSVLFSKKLRVDRLFDSGSRGRTKHELLSHVKVTSILGYNQAANSTASVESSCQLQNGVAEIAPPFGYAEPNPPARAETPVCHIESARNFASAFPRAYSVARESEKPDPCWAKHPQ